MNKNTLLGMALSVIVLTLGLAMGVILGTAKPEPAQVMGEKTKAQKSDKACTVIQDGTLLTSDGETITVGFDDWGYNYQARLFNGTYCDAYRDADWCQPYKDIDLTMKWNDAWLSNKDCDGDGKLDRHYSFDSYIGSGAWLTNQQSGEYEDEEGNICRWNYFVKIVAVPADAKIVDGIWYTEGGEENGKEIGPVIWGEFAVIHEVSNDPCLGDHGVLYKNEAPSGFGFYDEKGK